MPEHDLTEITCNPETGAITHVWSNHWWWDEQSAIRHYDAGERFFIGTGSDRVEVRPIKLGSGLASTRYLRSDPDKTERNNLLNLPRREPPLTLGSRDPRRPAPEPPSLFVTLAKEILDRDTGPRRGR